MLVNVCWPPYDVFYPSIVLPPANVLTVRYTYPLPISCTSHTLTMGLIRHVPYSLYGYCLGLVITIIRLSG